MGNPSAQPRKRRPSIKTVAAMAGVSWSTVSNVINNHHSVRPETRAKVEEAIEILGYRPNAAGRSLRRGTTSTLLLLTGTLTDLQDAALTDALTRQCQDEGLPATIHTTTTQSITPEHALDHIHSQGWDAAAILGSACAHMRAPSGTPLPLATVLPRPGSEGITTWILENLSVAISELVELAQSHGAHRICLAADDVRLGALLPIMVEVLGTHGMSVGAGAVLRAHACTFEAGADLASQVRANQPDAIVCAHEEIALGLRAALGHVDPPLLSTLRGTTYTHEHAPDIAMTLLDPSAAARSIIHALVEDDPTAHEIIVPHQLLHPTI